MASLRALPIVLLGLPLLARGDYLFSELWTAPSCGGNGAPAQTLAQIVGCLPVPRDQSAYLRCVNSSWANYVVFSGPTCTGIPVTSVPVDAPWGCTVNKTSGTSARLTCVDGTYSPPTTNTVNTAVHASSANNKCPGTSAIELQAASPTGVCLPTADGMSYKNACDNTKKRSSTILFTSSKTCKGASQTFPGPNYGCSPPPAGSNTGPQDVACLGAAEAVEGDVDTTVTAAEAAAIVSEAAGGVWATRMAALVSDALAAL